MTSMPLSATGTGMHACVKCIGLRNPSSLLLTPCGSEQGAVRSLKQRLLLQTRCSVLRRCRSQQVLSDAGAGRLAEGSL